MRTPFSLDVANPTLIVSLQYQADAVAISNYTASPVYVRIGSNNIPSSADYDYIIPPGIYSLIPCNYASYFAFSLGLALNTLIRGSNLTNRVDVTTYKGELPIAAASSYIARPDIQVIPFSVGVSGAATYDIDTRYAKGINLALNSSGGDMGMLMEYTQSPPIGPWFYQRGVRFPQTGLQYSVLHIPVLGNAIRLVIKELSGVASSGYIIYTLTDTYEQKPDWQHAEQVRVSRTGIPLGTVVLHTIDYDSGIIDSLHLAFTNLDATYSYIINIAIDQTVGGGGFSNIFTFSNLATSHLPLTTRGIVITPAHEWCSMNTATVKAIRIPLCLPYNIGFGVTIQSLAADADVIIASTVDIRRSN